MSQALEYELEAELESEYESGLEAESEYGTQRRQGYRTPRQWVQVRQVRGADQELEGEAFDPSPPPPGTTLLTRFPFGGAQVSAAHRALIARFASSIIADMPRLPPLHCFFIPVEGHEDEVGDPARFGRLGRARATAVITLLVPRLVAGIGRLPAAQRREIRIGVSTAGPARPIRSNVTADGRALNRRVELRRRSGPCGPIA